MNKRPGMFLSFEGTEGSGKTTQMRILVDRLRSAGFTVVENQEPGGTAIGKQIRRILLDPESHDMDSVTELLLMFASRAQAAAEVIRPALARGELVVSDRFTDSTLAYQGWARGLGFDLVQRAHQLAVGSLLPDLTLCVLSDLEEGLARARSRNTVESRGDRLDAHDLEFHKLVRDGYLKIAGAEAQRFRIVDGSGTPEQVAERVWKEVAPRLRA